MEEVEEMALKKKVNDYKRKLITRFNSRSPISEQYRTIRTNIQFSAVDKEVKSIVITSSEPNEGKSTTIANLAIVFAQQGKKVLLVDADLRKPRIHYMFNLTNTNGLTNVLTKQAVLSDAIFQTDVDNLSVIPSGPIPPNPSELLGSKSMEMLIDTLYSDFEIILFDTPPVLAVTDAILMANKCDGTILVVSSGMTEMGHAKKAKDALLSADAFILGTVLNNKKQTKDSTYYYYGN